jgi:hypothetical protein
MKIIARLGGLVTAAVVSVSLGEAEPLKYLGRQGEVPTGWIEFGHERYYEIGAGTEIPSWGHVVEVRDDRIVVEQVRTEAEKQGMEERGALVHDVLEIHVLREDLRLLPSTALPVR